MVDQALGDESRLTRDLKLEARGAAFDKTCDELLLKWNHILLPDCNTLEQFLTFKAMVMVLQQMRLKLVGEMKGER